MPVKSIAQHSYLKVTENNRVKYEQALVAEQISGLYEILDGSVAELEPAPEAVARGVRVLLTTERLTRIQKVVHHAHAQILKIESSTSRGGGGRRGRKASRRLVVVHQRMIRIMHLVVLKLAGYVLVQQEKLCQTVDYIKSFDDDVNREEHLRVEIVTGEHA